ncbi:MAG: uracil-DNA glycosylase [Rhodobacteraceae bacterium]|nr:uracil-DNA glycosylase [Paracoccaceae bacterium]MBO27200.1 uracil-DNA glycosylase [Paracoccaceae bacterium]
MVAEATDLGTQVARAARLALLDAPHMCRLNVYCGGLRNRGRDVPWFDPLDGGEHASMLILLERPARRGEGPRFVSRDNPSPTQRNLKRSLERAGLERRTTLIWNVVPWLPHPNLVRNRPPRAAELTESLAQLPALLCLLESLQVIVLAGRWAGKANAAIKNCGRGIPVIEIPHPSPVYVNTDPVIQNRIDERLETGSEIANQHCVKSALTDD